MSDPIIIATCTALAATGAYRVTSPATRRYNCVAWAASRTDRWWWPSPFAYWPVGVPNEETVAAFEAAYTTLGYRRCPDGRFELAFERVAIFALAGVPKHAARYWRALESAFGRRGAKLIKLLANYPPAKVLGYSEDELESLRALRGRASHADSKGGAKELAEVKAEVMKKMTRLKTLVERVIVTKKTWGIPTLELEELAPVVDHGITGHINFALRTFSPAALVRDGVSRLLAKSPGLAIYNDAIANSYAAMALS